MLTLESAMIEASAFLAAVAVTIWRLSLKKSDKKEILEELEKKVDKTEFDAFKIQIVQNQLVNHEYLEKIENHIIMMDNNWRTDLNKHFCALKEDLKAKSC